MCPVFISYATEDLQYAQKVQAILSCAGISSWFAPTSISPGKNFTEEIGNALIFDNSKDELAECSVVIALLTKNYMLSPWCEKELVLAIKKSKKLFVIQLDHSILTPKYEFLLSNEQLTHAYHLNEKSVRALLEEMRTFLAEHKVQVKRHDVEDVIPISALHIERITAGDPYFEDGQTLRCVMTKQKFFLAPPRDGLDAAQLSFLEEHHFATEDYLLDTSWEAISAGCGVPDIVKRVAESRRRVLDDFLTGGNGCYYNNKKYGLNRINPFCRTEDLSEDSEVIIEFYMTDYYTHRVMKDVCKQLYHENPCFFYKSVNISHLKAQRIFFTSLGINLLLLDTAKGGLTNALLTCRSKYATETYGTIRYSMSAIEGVSLVDYDPYKKSVSLSLAAERGLEEELGVPAELLKRDSLRFYDIFVNLKNLEVGIACSIELKEGKTLQNDVIPLHGKDEALEVAQKFILPVSQMHEFLIKHFKEFVFQAAYSMGVYLESLGVSVLGRSGEAVLLEEEFIEGKQGQAKCCGDAIYKGKHYFAIIDGNTPKGTKQWNNQPGDVFVAQYLKQQMKFMPPNLSAEEVIARLNSSLLSCYEEGEFSTLAPEERLSAVVLIYSRDKKEIWNFGDCQYRVNGVLYNFQKPIDRLLAGVRSFFIETELRLGKTNYELQEHDTGREAILPFLKRQSILANQDCPFGYDTLDGGCIILEHIRKHLVKTGDHVVLASDGYPTLFDSLKESEASLKKVLEEDPLCIHENRGTKALKAGNCSYDDRSFLSFIVK